MRSARIWLFNRPLGQKFRAAARQAKTLVPQWPPDALLSTAEADLAEGLTRLVTFEMPSLARDKAWLEPSKVLLTPDDQDTFTRFTLVVPITGKPPIFSIPSTRTYHGRIKGEIAATTLRLYCDNPANADQARAYFERSLDVIERRLDRTRADIKAHNHRMAKQITAAIARRRAKLLKDQAIEASIGYPITRRPDADTYRVPVKRRTITPGRPARPSGRSNAYVPEPTIDEADYEAVLAVLRNARNALERSPSMSAKLDEEETRDLLLVMLNAQFEGKAAGEVFNCTGKTDILVRDGDRNVFIGECKIFDPKNKQSVDHVVTGALDQLLGYLVWRDTKAALLLLVRDADVSAVVDKALAAIRSHPSHKRPGKVSTEERHDFVLHASGDLNREIRLAFLPFLIGSRNAPATKTVQSAP
jgi:hypothetical protein